MAIDQPSFDDQPLIRQDIKTILENRAEQIGDKVFVHYGPNGEDITYSEMNNISNRIANSLIEHRIQKGEKVSVMMRNPLETLYVMFGINKCGAVYSPINFDYTGQALSYQINDIKPELLFLDERYIPRLNSIADDLEPKLDVVVIGSDSSSEDLDGPYTRLNYDGFLKGGASKPDTSLMWNDAASILYTSGTTGKPKGVVLPYRWIFGNYCMMRQAIFTQDDVVHVPIPLYHVGGTYWDITSALIAGASVSLWDRFSTDEFWDRIEKYNATSVTLISTMQSWLHGKEQEEDDRFNTLNKVQMAPLPTYYDRMAERFGFDIITSVYGSTEAGAPLAGIIHAAKEEDSTPQHLRHGMSPERVIDQCSKLDIPVVDTAPGDQWLGKPMSSIVDVTVLDELDEEVPPGERPGELAVRPKKAGMLLKEYYGKPEKTVDAFRNFWFHGGDAVFQDDDSHYHFVDRIDDVIRRRGENISSHQVQDIIKSNESVSECAVFPIPAESGGEDEVAVAIQLASDNEQARAELYNHIDSELPEFMSPEYIKFVESIPTTETNKIEKYKLKAELFDR